MARLEGNKFRFASSIVVFLLSTLVTQIQARSFPPTASRSFRFPNDDGWNEIRNSETVQPKNAHIERTNNIPSSSDPRSSIMKDEWKEVSAESEEESKEAVAIDAGEPGKEHKKSEDEELRDVLCPPTNTSKPSAGDKDVEEGVKEPFSDTESEDAYSRIRYDLLAGKCAHVGRKEHCGENMIFVADIDSSAYGYCECDFENKLGRKSGEKRGHITPLVFHQETNSCYRLYEQAFCKGGEWLVINREKKGSYCEKRKCPSLPVQESIISRGEKGFGQGRRRNSKLLTPSLWSDSGRTDTKELLPSSIVLPLENDGGISKDAGLNDGNASWVPLNGTGPCVQLNKENTDYCYKGEQILFKVGAVVPKCGIPGREFEARAVIHNACPPGSFFSIIGRCQPDWDF